MMDGIDISKYSRAIDATLASNEQGSQKVAILLDAYLICAEADREKVAAALIHRLIMEHTRRTTRFVSSKLESVSPPVFCERS